MITIMENNNNLKNQNEYGNNQEIISTIEETNIKPNFKNYKDKYFFDKLRKIETKEELNKKYEETLKYGEDRYKDLQESIKETNDNILNLLEKDREEGGKNCLTFMRSPITLKAEFDEMEGKLNFKKSYKIKRLNKEKYLTAYDANLSSNPTEIASESKPGYFHTMWDNVIWNSYALLKSSILLYSLEYPSVMAIIVFVYSSVSSSSIDIPFIIAVYNAVAPVASSLLILFLNS